MQHVEEFLEIYIISSTIQLSDPTWTEFFGVVVERFPSAQTHSYLAVFLKKCSGEYRKTGRSLEFVTDLLKLNVENLLSGKWEFQIYGSIRKMLRSK